MVPPSSRNNAEELDSMEYNWLQSQLKHVNIMGDDDDEENDWEDPSRGQLLGVFEGDHALSADAQN